MVNSYSIEGTLNFGMKLSKKFFICIFLCWAIMALTCFVSIILHFCSVAEMDIGDLWVLIVAFVVFLVADIVILSFYICQHNFFKHKVNEFLNDSLLLESKARIYEVGAEGPGPFKIYKVVAVFKYENDEMKIIGKKHSKQFKKFIGKEVDILYSPKYEEVMFLKDN